MRSVVTAIKVNMTKEENKPQGHKSHQEGHQRVSKVIRVIWRGREGHTRKGEHGDLEMEGI